MPNKERPRYAFCGNRRENVGYLVDDQHYMTREDVWSEIVTQKWINVRDAMWDLMGGDNSADEFRQEAPRYLTEMGVSLSTAKQFCEDLINHLSVCLSFCIFPEFVNSGINEGSVVDPETVEISYPEN